MPEKTRFFTDVFMLVLTKSGFTPWFISIDICYSSIDVLVDCQAKGLGPGTHKGCHYISVSQQLKLDSTLDSNKKRHSSHSRDERRNASWCHPDSDYLFFNFSIAQSR